VTRGGQGLLLIAGGVGITPLRGLYHAARADGVRVDLVLLARSGADVPYLAELEGRPGVHLHTTGTAGHRFDLWPLLAEPGERSLVVCGPPGLVTEVRELSVHWPAVRVHEEGFAATGPASDRDPFTVVWAPTGQRIPVPADRTVVEAARAVGLVLPSSCGAGACGTCRLRIVSGEVDHHDAVLTPAEQVTAMTPCVSRGVSEVVLAPATD
jgi:phthalate 4,5-dioxygenase reductase subunit